MEAEREAAPTLHLIKISKQRDQKQKKIIFTALVKIQEVKCKCLYSYMFNVMTKKAFPG